MFNNGYFVFFHLGYFVLFRFIILVLSRLVFLLCFVVEYLFLQYSPIRSRYRFRIRILSAVSFTMNFPVASAVLWTSFLKTGFRAFVFAFAVVSNNFLPVYI